MNAVNAITTSVRQLPVAVVHMRQNIAFDVMAAIQQTLIDRFGVIQRGQKRFPRIGNVHVTGPLVIMEIDPASISEAERKAVIQPSALAEYSNAVKKPVWGLPDMPKWSRAPSPGAWLVTSIGNVRQLAPGEYTMRDEALVSLPPRYDDVPSGSLDLDDEILQGAGELAVPIGRVREMTGGALETVDLLQSLRRIIHILAIGETGSGKTNWFKAALLALIKQATPDEIKFAFISPKVSEFAEIANSAYAWTSAKWDGHIAYEVKDADTLVAELRREFHRRDAELFVGDGVTDILAYNRLHPGRELPRVILIVDEIVDLIANMPRGSQFKEHLSGLTSIGRSAGVHVFAGTTNMNYQVLPTTWSRNVPNTIMFRVNDASICKRFGCPGANLIGDSDDERGVFVANINGRLWKGKAYRAMDRHAMGQPAEAGERSPKAARPERTLTEREASLVVYAVERLGGRFTINKLWEAFRDDGWSANAIGKLGAEWEKLNWLTQQAEAGRGRSGSRMVKPVLEMLARERVRTSARANAPAGSILAGMNA